MTPDYQHVIVALRCALAEVDEIHQDYVDAGYSDDEAAGLICAGLANEIAPENCGNLETAIGIVLGSLHALEARLQRARERSN